MMLRPIRVSAPAVQPVSLAEAKANMRVEHSEDDSLIEMLIEAATAHLDGWSGILGRALITQTWRIDAPSWGNPLRLPLLPIRSISSVAYWDTTNADKFVAADQYLLHVDAIGPALHLVSGASWPGVFARQDAIRVTFVAGYGSDPQDVPAPIRRAILLLVAHWYNSREAVGLSQLKELPLGVEALLAPFKTFS